MFCLRITCSQASCLPRGSRGIEGVVHSLLGWGHLNNCLTPLLVIWWEMYVNSHDLMCSDQLPTRWEVPTPQLHYLISARTFSLITWSYDQARTEISNKHFNFHTFVSLRPAYCSNYSRLDEGRWDIYHSYKTCSWSKTEIKPRPSTRFTVRKLLLDN